MSGDKMCEDILNQNWIKFYFLILSLLTLTKCFTNIKKIIMVKVINKIEIKCKYQIITLLKTF